MLGVEETARAQWVKQGETPVITNGPNLTLIEVAELQAFLTRDATRPADPSDAAE